MLCCVLSFDVPTTAQADIRIRGRSVPGAPPAGLFWSPPDSVAPLSPVTDWWIHVEDWMSNIETDVMGAYVVSCAHGCEVGMVTSVKFPSLSMYPPSATSAPLLVPVLMYTIL